MIQFPHRQTRSKSLWLPLWIAMLAMMIPFAISAHDLTVGKAVMTFDEASGTWRLTLDTDILAIAGGEQAGHLEQAQADRMLRLPAVEQQAQLEQVRELLKTQMTLRFDGGEATSPESAALPKPADVFTQNALAAQIRGRTITMTGITPGSARQLTLRFPELIGPVSATVKAPGDAEGQNQLIQTGAESQPFALKREDALAAAPPLWRTVAQYLALGFEHILPKGLDHILFVLGLFLLSAKWRPLLWQVTAFTVAHTITLALAITGHISAPGSIVEPLIALSIAFVAVENIATSKLKPWRPAVVFGFGLLHGMGFAGVLMDLGLPKGQLTAALVSFNIGVELGQLAVIGLAFLAVGWFHSRAWYRQRVVVPASALIALVGVYWTVERVFF